MDKKVVSVQSLHRTTGTPEDFTIIDSGKNFTNNPKSVKASLVCIPYTWYNVDEDMGNVFSWTGTMSGAHSIVVPDNNYTGATLATQLQTQMELEAPGKGYTVTFDTVTNKFTISAGETFTIDFTVSDNMHLILGWTEVVVAPAASTHTSTNVAGFVLDKSVWVCTDMISGVDNGIIPWTDDLSPVDEHILAEVPIMGCFGCILVFSPPPDLPFFPITNSDFSLVNRPGPRNTRFYLKFPSGSVVNLNGQEWSMQVIFDFNKPVNGIIN